MVTVNTTSMSRVSISSSAAPANGPSGDQSISANGRFITFQSNSTTLFPIGNNSTNAPNIYLRDTQTGTTQVVSLGYKGSTPLESSTHSTVSDDGRFIAFESSSRDFIPDDVNTNSMNRIFIRDMASGTTFKVPHQGDPDTTYDDDAQITGDGRYVVYHQSTGLIYRYDRLAFETSMASVTNTGAAPTDQSLNPDISGDGRFVVFDSLSSNFLDSDGGDSNATADIFRRDMDSGITERISLTDADGEANSASLNPTISGNGRYVAFTSLATNLVGGTNNGLAQIFVRDTIAGTTKLVSAGTDPGAQGNAASSDADISADGRYVVFDSEASNLVRNDINGRSDVFLRDTVLGTTVRLSVTPAGTDANGDSGSAQISADGRSVTFVSGATNLAPGDGNGVFDVFRVSLFATEGADILYGSDAADTISALGGNDIIRGALGADKMTGGAGNDSFYVDNVNDLVTEVAGGGTDTIYTSSDYTLRVGVAVETLRGSSAIFSAGLKLTGNELVSRIVGEAADDTLNGGGGGDTLVGGGGNDSYQIVSAGDKIVETSSVIQGTADKVFSSVTYTLGAGVAVEFMQTNLGAGTSAINLYGNEFAQSIAGNNGVNRLEGKGGADTLRGLGGADTFVFASTLGGGNIDTIVDFNPVDHFVLSSAIFTALTPGTITSAQFRANTTGEARDSTDRIIYDTDSGGIFYDADGLGGAAGVQFATVGVGLAITNADFVVG